MLSNSLIFKEGMGRTAVIARVKNTGRGILVLLVGGTSPHIGGVVLALPRPSLEKEGLYSSDCFIIPIPGHKDHIPAKGMAQRLAKELRTPCVVSAGIHSDDMSRQEIDTVLKNVKRLTSKIINSNPYVVAHGEFE